MSKTAVSHTYRKTQILTAAPAELLVLLYNAALCFCDQARTRMAEKKYEESHDLLVRAENVVLELSSGLRKEVYPELVKNLAKLYEFIFYRLVEANVSHNPKCIEDAAQLLTMLRDTWVVAASRTAGDKGAVPAEEVKNVELSA